MLQTLQSKVRSSQTLADIRLRLAQISSSFEKDEEVANKIDNGVYEFGQLYDTSLVDKLREDLKERLLDDEIADIEKSEGSEVYRSIFLDSEEEWVEEIVGNEELQNTVRSYFGADFKTTLVGLLRYKKGEGESVATQLKWHLDTSAPPNSIRLLIFMTDQKEVGAFELVDSESTEDLLEDFEYEELHQDPAKVRENAEIESFTGKRGSALLTNVVDQLHRGREPAPGEDRYIMVLSFVPSMGNLTRS